MQKWLLFIVGLVVFGLSLLAHIPAQLLLRDNSGKLQFAGVSGTAWRGEIRQILFTNKVLPVQDLNWRMNPAALLTGKYKAHFYEEQAPANNGYLSINLFSRKLELHAVQWQTSTASLAQVFPLRVMSAQGQYILELDSLQLPVNAVLPSQLQGRLEWRNAALQTNGETWRIGSPVIALTVESGTIKGQVTNAQPTLPGDIGFECTLNSCQVALNLRPSPNAPQALLDGLLLLGLQQNGETFSGQLAIPVLITDQGVRVDMPDE
jgi:hypothetical protein